MNPKFNLDSFILKYQKDNRKVSEEDIKNFREYLTGEIIGE
jgi:hypothetical protein